jgi:iron(III) transport system ATP-binding protein
MIGIRVGSISKAFGRTTALSGVSFTVPQGAFATLLGPSGCGKTTMLRLIAGLDFADSGSIWINDEMVSGPGRRVAANRRNIGFVFQSYALWPHMTVFDQVAYPLRARRAPRAEISQRVRETLELVGLTAHEDRYPAQLSGGQQQRVALARALVFRPHVLLLDEPLSNLDAELRGQMRDELHRFHQRVGVTMVFVTHDQHEALALSDTIVVMNNGTVVEQGTPTEIYETPRKALTAAFMGGTVVAAGAVVDLSPEFARLAGPDGTIVEGMHAGDLEAGKSAVLSVKPEHVSIFDNPIDGHVGLRATIERAIYLGAHTLVEVRVAGEIVRVHVPGAPKLAPGNEVFVNFPREKARVLSVAPVAGSQAE